MYLQRMNAFAEFYSRFYDGQRTFALDPAKQIDIFDYPELNLTIVGFSSCHNNDLYNRQGAIHPACIAEAGRRLRNTTFTNHLRIAVWHHNTEGPPASSDYMDPDLIQNLIDREFSLGLHGHQHRPQYLDTRFRHGIERKILVISAGTLCGEPNFRHGRAYNIIELNTADREGRLHVREMQNDNFSLPIWGHRALPPNTIPYYAFYYDPPPSHSHYPNESTTVMVEAQNFHLTGENRKVVELLRPIVNHEPLARPLLLDCLVKLKDTRALLTHFDPPANEAEAIHVIDALWECGERERLFELLDGELISNSEDPIIVAIRQKYLARRK